MKHIFVVHSNITYLAALATIELLGLKAADTLIASQHYRRQVPLPVVRLRLFTRNIFRPARFFNFAWHTDRLVERFTQGDQFELYVPAITKPAKLLATNAKCHKINFIEEGIGSYLRQFPDENHVYEYRTGFTRSKFSIAYLKSTLTAVLNLVRGESQRLTAMPLNYTSYAGNPAHDFYGFHPRAFPVAPSRHLLSMSSLSKYFIDIRAIDLSGQHILIGEGLFSLSSQHSVDQYISILEVSVLPWLTNNNITNLYLKHHYNESPESRRRSADVFRQTGIAITVIPDSTILEVELMGTQNTTLIGLSSSLLFYGALMGCESYSYASHAGLPLLDIETYWQQVELI